MTTDELNPTDRIRHWLGQLIARNPRAGDAEVGDMFLGQDIFVAQLKYPKVIEGQWENVDKTADLFDLMDDHQHGRR